MSRYYEMSVEISGHDPAKVSEIQSTAAAHWPFDNWWFSDAENQDAATMRASAQESLCGGESEEQFAERLSVAIWQANGSFCRVSVDATFLENLPYQTHVLDEADYGRLIQGKTSSKRRRSRE
jgi:hypothetical protein